MFPSHNFSQNYTLQIFLANINAIKNKSYKSNIFIHTSLRFFEMG